MVVEFKVFKGNKLIVLKKDSDDLFPFQFGKMKAKLILANIDAIEKFSNEPEVTTSEDY